MNFVDAAVELLREADAPLHVEELCRLALERHLLDSPGANPLRSFKGRLTTELKRGEESRVVRVEDDLWTLSDVGRDGGGDAAPDERDEGQPDAPVARERGYEGAPHADAADIEGGGESEADEEDDAEALTGEEGESDEQVGFDDDRESPEADIDPDQEDQEHDQPRRGDGRSEGEAAQSLSPEEAELAAVYGDEVGTAQVGALSEYRDEQT